MASSEQRSRDQTRTYDRHTSVVFLKTQEAFGGLSNMAGGFPLRVNGARILTSEALYQACRFPHLPDVQRLIIEQRSPMTAKMKSKPYRNDSRPDWDSVRVKVMRWCLRVKLAQNWAAFSGLLLETGNRPIVEQSRKDDFWGAKVMDDLTLVGMNVLGRLLMELRESVKREPRESLLRVDPLSIAKFLLLGKPIQPVQGASPAISPSSAQWVPQPAGVRHPAQPDAPTTLFDRARGQATPQTQSAPSTLVDGLHPYSEYQDSGLPWLGRVPAHWDVRRNGRLFAQRNETGWGSLPILEVSLRTGVRVRNMDDLKRKQVMSDREKYKRAIKGDIAYNMMRMWQGAVGVAPEDGLVSPAYVVARPYPEAEPRYFSYLFRTDAYKNEVDGYSRGIVKDRNRLYWEDFKRMPSCFPPPDEQKAIADYLDANAIKVRRFIRNRRRLIEVLNEQKQAIINRAVTRGLDPNAPLKPSGIDWLGDIPEHWSVVSLRRVAQSLDGQRVPLNAEQRGRMQGEYPYWGANTVIDHVDQWLFDEDLVLLGEDGAPFFIRGRDVAFHVSGKVWVNNHAHVLRPKGIVPQFLAHALNCVDYAEYVGGATRDKLTAQSMKAIPIQLPPTDEQARICAVIADAVEPVVSAREKASREIDLIREYRTRLIADVVTGKMDVRGLAPTEPCLDDEQIDEGTADEEMLGDDEPELVEEAADADD